MLQIDLTRIPAQEFDTELDGQKCTLKIYQRGDYMYMDISVNSQLVRSGMICMSDTIINTSETPLFKGWFAIVDDSNRCGIPNWKEFNDRYILLYISEEEL